MQDVEMTDRIEKNRKMAKAERKQLQSGFTLPGTNLKGKWLPEDTKFDSELEARREYVAKGNPLGTLSVDDKFLEGFNRKREKEEYVKTLRLANYLIDDKVPESQERVFSIFNELRDVPDEEFMRNLQNQDALRLILRNGALKGREDHLLLMELMKPDYLIPISPIWDDETKYLETAQISLDQIKLAYKADQLYTPLWNPSESTADRAERFSKLPDTNKAALVKVLAELMPVKVKIAERLLPGMKQIWDSKNASVAQRAASLVTLSTRSFVPDNGMITSKLQLQGPKIWSNAPGKYNPLDWNVEAAIYKYLESIGGAKAPVLVDNDT
jgi:hypothetical protein